MNINSGQCSCNGDNPDCFRCYGTGMIQPLDTQKRSKAYDVGQASSLLLTKPKSYNDLPNRVAPELLLVQKRANKPAKRIPPTAKKAKKAVKPAGASPYKNANKHKVAEVFIKPTSIKPVNIMPVKPVTATIECPICCSFILKTFLSFSNHLMFHTSDEKNKHKKIVDRTFQIIAVPAPVVKTTPLTPPIMEIFSNRPSSSRSSTKTTITKPQVSKFSNYKKIPSTDEQPGGRIISREVDTRKIDSTFGQHTIRESGRFGSHPSHDNFDDESGA